MLTCTTAALACALTVIAADNGIQVDPPGVARHGLTVVEQPYYVEGPQHHMGGLHGVSEPIVLGEPGAPLGTSCHSCMQSGNCHAGGDVHTPDIFRFKYGGHVHTWRSHSTCNMYPRIMYLPEAHGYYYFRPYNYTKVWQQQSIAVQWGVDPRNPYSNQLFQGIYREVELQNLPVPEPIAPPSMVPPSAPATEPSEVPPAPALDGEPTVQRSSAPRAAVRFLPAAVLTGDNAGQ